MILLNLGLENSPGWDLVPDAIKEAYVTTPPLGGKKIILNEDNFLYLTSEEVRNVFILCHTVAYHEWRSLYILLPSPWRVYPHYYLYNKIKINISQKEMYEKIQKGDYPDGFVSVEGNVIYF